MIIGYNKEKALAKEIAATDFNVLIVGESGVGKTVFARFIHESSKRSSYPYYYIHCPNLQSNLFESEFFGHKKGSFTDAKLDKIGALELAKGGTIFLDEIGELCEEFQSKLLNPVESKTYRMFGDSKERRSDVRFIFATNKDLVQKINEGTFRLDLYYRIASHVFKIPPLRENKNNIAEISKYFWKKLSNNTIELIDKEIDILCDYNYPGNIRELESILKCVWLKCSNNHDFNRLEIIKLAIDASSFHADGNNKIISQDIIALCIERMKKGESFWDVVHRPYIKRKISIDHLKEIIQINLKLCHHDSRKLMEFFHVPEDNYKKIMNFLNSQGIKLSQFKL